MWSLVVVKTARTENRNKNGNLKYEKGQEYEVAQKGQEAGSYQAPYGHEKVLAKREKVRPVSNHPYTGGLKLD
jgi:hypothetical protein